MVRQVNVGRRQNVREERSKKLRVMAVLLTIGILSGLALRYGVRIGGRIVLYPYKSSDVTLQCINERLVDWREMNRSGTTKFTKRSALKSAKAYCECQTEAMFLSGQISFYDFKGHSKVPDRTSNFSIAMRTWQRTVDGQKAIKKCVREAFPIRRGIKVN